MEGQVVNKSKKVENKLEKVENKLKKSESIIVKTMRYNPNITTNQLKLATNLSIQGINECILSLKKKGVIIRVGAKKNGYWKVL